MPYYYEDLDYYSRYGVYRSYDVYDPVYGAWDPAYPYARYPQYYPSHYSSYPSSYYPRSAYYDDLYDYRYRSSAYYPSSYYPRASDHWDPVLRRYVPYVSAAYDPYYAPSPIRPASAYLSTPSPARRRAMSVGRF
jgi:hypothetical protein